MSKMVQRDKLLAKIKYNEFMKLIIKTILIFILTTTFSYSACNFKANLGIKRSDFEKKNFAGAPMPLDYPGLNFYGILAEDVCPDQNLKDIAIEYKFLNEELVAINLIALNDYTNSVSEKLTLMNYVKKNYGQFDTTQNPKSYTGYEVIEKANQFVVYQRIPNNEGVIDEQIYISTSKLDNKLMKYMQNMEMQTIKDSE
tara:strand:+ start:1193 stop:1789 length:597 start_codon:yes stop_codon:yes gene_type:complete